MTPGHKKMPFGRKTVTPGHKKVTPGAQKGAPAGVAGLIPSESDDADEMVSDVTNWNRETSPGCTGHFQLYI